MLSRNAFSQNSENFKFFELDELSAQNAEIDSRYLEFMNLPTFKVGLYELETGDRDNQNPHKLDEIYYVTRGKAKLAVGETVVNVKPGSIIYVKAKIPHNFFAIKEDLQVLVMFSTENSDSD